MRNNQNDKKTKMTVGGFCSPAVVLSGDNPRTPNPAAFKDIAELGITHLVPDHFQCDFGDAPEDALVYMDRAHEAGLKVYVYDTALGCRTSAGHTTRADAWDTTWAKIYVKHPAFAGVHFFDEPFGHELKTVANKQNLWRHQFANKDFLVNLLPSYAPDALLKTTFRAYIDQYINLCKPDILSFDHYALFENGETRATFFADTALIGYAAKKHNLPSHFYILSSGHEPYRRGLTVSELRWQLAVGMTFGLRSFTHYTAGAAYDGYDEMIDKNGNRTALWHNIQTVNIELNKWSHVYLSFSYDGFTAVGGSHGRENPMFTAIAAQDGLIKKCDIKAIKTIHSTQDVLIGSFSDRAGNCGFMLTNASSPNAKSQNRLDRQPTTVRLQLSDKYAAVQIFTKGEPTVCALSDDRTVIVDLEAGEGKFLIPLKK